jgi:hypothetical protein
VPEDAVGCEPVSAPNSLLTGKLTGNLPISGVSAANLTTSLRACARPDRAAWAACRRRRGDRVVFFAAIAHSRYWHFSAVPSEPANVRSWGGERTQRGHAPTAESDPHRSSDVQCTGCRVAVRATLPWSVYVGAPDPDTNVPILPITFEPFDRLRRQMVGEPFPGD